MADGRLRQGDPALASRQFAAMCQSGCFNLTLYAIGRPDSAAVQADVEAAVDSFMRAWGPEYAAGPTPADVR